MYNPLCLDATRFYEIVSLIVECSANNQGYLRSFFWTAHDNESQRLVEQLEQSMDHSNWVLIAAPRRIFHIPSLPIPAGEIAGKWVFRCITFNVGGRMLFAEAILLQEKIVSVTFSGTQIGDESNMVFIKTTFLFNPAMPQLGEDGLGSGSCP